MESRIELDYKKSLERFRNLGDKYYEKGGEVFFDISDNLMKVSIFALGFIGIWLSISSNNKDSDLKVWLIFGIVLLSSSLLFGLWIKFRSNEFFNQWGDLYFTKHEKLYHYMKNTGKDSGEMLPEYIWKAEENKLNQHFSPWQFKVQIYLLGAGIISMGFVLLKLL